MLLREQSHRYLGVEMSGQGVVAVCVCGWRSRPYSAAGLAGSSWDRHLELVSEPTGGASTESG